jgi:predicted Zn-dependent peptidase
MTSRLEELSVNHAKVTLESYDNFKVNQLTDKFEIPELKTIPTRTSKTLVFEQKNIPQTHLFFGYATKGYCEFNNAVVTIASSMLSGLECGLAFQRIREEKSLAYAVWQNHVLSRSYGLHYFYAGVAEKNLYETIEVLIQIIHEMHDSQKHRSLFEIAKKVAIGKIKKTMDNPEYALRYYLREFSQDFEIGNTRTLSQYLKNVENTKFEEVVEYFEKVYKNNKPLVYAIGNIKNLDQAKFKSLLNNV